MSRLVPSVSWSCDREGQLWSAQADGAAAGWTTRNAPESFQAAPPRSEVPVTFHHSCTTARVDGGSTASYLAVQGGRTYLLRVAL